MLQLLQSRIKELITVKGFKKDVDGFAELIKVQPRTLKNHLASPTKADGNPNPSYRTISIETILGIVNAFPDLDCNWLLRGEGGMFADQSEEPVSSYSLQGEELTTQSPIQVYQILYEQKNKECLELARELGKLEAKLELK